MRRIECRVGRRREAVLARSCVAQRETFNSVTPGLNYHAETIVLGKIKKGAPARRRTPRRRSPVAEQRTIVLRRRERQLKYGRNEKDNDKIPFSFAGPVALGLTRLLLVKKENGENGDKK